MNKKELSLSAKKNIFNKRIDLQKQVYSMEASMAVERKKHKQLH